MTKHLHDTRRDLTMCGRLLPRGDVLVGRSWEATCQGCLISAKADLDAEVRGIVARLKEIASGEAS